MASNSGKNFDDMVERLISGGHITPDMGERLRDRAADKLSKDVMKEVETLEDQASREFAAARQVQRRPVQPQQVQPQEGDGVLRPKGSPAPQEVAAPSGGVQQPAPQFQPDAFTLDNIQDTIPQPIGLPDTSAAPEAPLDPESEAAEDRDPLTTAAPPTQSAPATAPGTPTPSTPAADPTQDLKREDFVTGEQITPLERMSEESAALREDMKKLPEVRAKALEIIERAKVDKARLSADEISSYENKAADIVKQDAETLDEMTNNLNDRISKYDKMNEKILNNKVDAQRFIKGMDTGSRLMTFIGIALSGMNGGPNRALQLLENSIDRDIKEQEFNINTQKAVASGQLPIMGQLQSMFKSKIALSNATKVTAIAALKNRLSQIQNTTSDEELKAKIALANSEFDLKATEKRDKALQAERLRLRDEVAMTIPWDKSKNFDREVVKDAKQLVMDTQIGLSNLDELESVFKLGPGKQHFNLATRAAIDNLRAGMTGELRVPILGGGPLTDTEREFLKKLIPDPTGIFTIEKNQIAILHTLVRKYKRKIIAFHKTHEIKLPEQFQIQDFEKPHWERANNKKK